MEKFEKTVEASFHDFVMTKAGLGIYDPHTPHRPRVAVSSFEIEILEIDDDLMVHAAGPVRLQGPSGDVEKFLRITLPVTPEGQIPEAVEVRAVYIEETNPENGACKETAALANG